MGLLQAHRPAVEGLAPRRLRRGKDKSLVMEVLALEVLRGEVIDPALRDLAAAAVQVNLGVSDPAGYCGLIQPDLDVPSLRNALNDASTSQSVRAILRR